MKRNILPSTLLWFFAAMFSFSGFSQSTVQIGTGTSTGQRLPIEPWYAYTYSQVIYLQSEIGTTGDITEVKWHFAGNSLSNSNNWDIYIGHTTKTAFTSSSDWIDVSTLTQVWSGTFADPGAAGWITFDITDFSYNNIDNLVIAVDENTSNNNNSSDDFYCTSVSGYRGLTEYSNSSNINPASPPAGSRKSYIANIILEFIATACPLPTYLTEANISQTSVDLGWTENGTATTWDMEYGAAGYTQGTGTTITGITNPHTLSGLSAGTAYSWYVRANCGGGNGQSSWSGPGTFSTLAPTQSIPFTEDWETGAIGSAWNTHTGSSATLQVNTASKHNGTYGLEQYGDGGSYTTPSGLADAYTKAQPGGVNENQTSWNSFTVDLTTATSPVLSFWYAMGRSYNNNYSNFWTQIDAGVGWVDLFAVQPSGSAIPYEKKTYDLSTYIGGTVVLRFFHNGKYDDDYLYLDDISVTEFTCPEPIDQTVSSITTTSVDLGWTENGTSTAWDIEWGAAGFVQGSGTTITGTTSNPYPLSGLSASTSYDWYVRADCGGGSSSNWTGPHTFSTTINSFPWTEDFENNGDMSYGWTQEYVSGTHDWIFHTGGYNNGNPSTAHGGTYNACFSPTSSGTKTYLITPQFDLSGQSNPQISFWHTQAQWEGDQDELRVYYKTTEGGTWTLIPGAVFTSSITSWTQETFNLPSPSSTYYIAFEGLDNFGYGVCVDDVEVSVSSCPAPTGLFADNISQTSVNLNWTTGGAATWNIEWGATGFTQGAGTMITGTTSNPYPLSSLTAGATYDFYVQDDCGRSQSSWTGPSSFTTLCNAITSFPWTEDFENAGARPDCWTEEYNIGSHDWAFQDGGDTDPISAHGGSYNAAFIHQSTSSSTKLITPQLDLSGLTNSQVSFWYAQVEDNGDQDKLMVYYKTSQGGAWTMIPGAEYTSNITNWTQVTLNLPSSNATYFVAFEGTDNYGQGVCIDDVVVDGTISCLPPTDLYSDNITTTSANLNWTTGGATTWNIEWGVKDFTQGTGTMITGTTTNPHSLSGLTANTLYDFYVQDDCGGGSQSTWTGPSTFCSAINSFPWTEDFENAGNRPDCWTEEYVSGTKDWDYRTGGVSSEPPTAHGGTYNASFDPGNVGNITMLITPTFDISSLTNPELEFWHIQTAWQGSVNTLKVYYKTAAGGAWTLIPGAEYTSEITAWTLESLALPSPSATYQIAFEGTDGGGLSICLDDVTVKNGCYNPSNQTEGNFTTTSADLDWTENGSATSWDIKRGHWNVGFSNAILVENVAKPYTYSGLTEGDAYDWWVRSNCSANGYSDWVGYSRFTLPCESRSLPWTEGFESMVFVGDQAVPTCMEIDDPNEWTTNDQYLTYNRVPYTGTNSIYNDGNDHPNDWLFSVPFDLVAGTSYDFSFWYITSGGQSWDFEAKYGTGQTTGEMTGTIGTTQTNINNTAYQRFRGSFSVTVSGAYYVSIHTWMGGYYNSYITFDDLLVEETPSCYPPMDQSTNDYTNTTAILNWTEDGSASTWDIEYGPTGYTQGTGTTVTGITAKPYTLTNLTENTVYDWYVRADCGSGDLSEWTGTDIFSTSITSFPYTESFENAVPPDCWNTTEVYYDGSGYRPIWRQVNIGGLIPPNWPPDDDKLAYFNSSQCSNGDKARLETPNFDLNAYSNMFMSFWMYHDDGSSSYNDKVQLQVQENNGDWQNLGNDILRYSTADGWSKHTVDLSAFCGNNITLGFLATSRFGYYMKIDKVTIHNSAPATANWTGTTNNNWYDHTNWSTNDIPYPVTNVTIPAGLTNYPTIATRGGECNNITIESGVAGDASLLDNGYLAVNGNTTIERYVTGGKWHDISASVNGATVNSLYFNGNPDVWLRTYNEPDNTTTYVTQLSTPMHPGQGFEVWVEIGSNVTAEFVGPLQTTDLTLNSTSTPPLSYSNPDPFGFNLIGNPYSSALDWDIGTWNQTDMAGTIWVWDNVSVNYKTRNSVGAGELTDGIIPMGQGFFVQATASTASITIPMDARVHSAQSYYKNTGGTNNAPPHIILRVNEEMGSDGVWITFSEEDTDGFDPGHDVRKMTGPDSSPQLYLVDGSQQYCIDALPPLDGEARLIPMHFKAGMDGEHILEAFDLDHLPETKILLEDIFTSHIQNLRKFPVYRFEAEKDQNPNRFLIHFNPITTQINDVNIDPIINIYSWDNEIYIVRNEEEIRKNGIVYVYDLQGRTVYSSKLLPQRINRIQINNGNSYYVVRVIMEGSVINKKVFVRKE